MQCTLHVSVGDASMQQQYPRPLSRERTQEEAESDRSLQRRALGSYSFIEASPSWDDTAWCVWKKSSHALITSHPTNRPGRDLSSLSRNAERPDCALRFLGDHCTRLASGVSVDASCKLTGYQN